MVESLVQRHDALNLLPKLEANIRAGNLIDVPPVILERIELGGSRPDEKMVEALCGLCPSAKTQLIRAVLENPSEMAEELDEGLVMQFASDALCPTAGRTQQKRARGRPRRNDRERLSMYVSHLLMTRRRGDSVGQTRREIGNWQGTQPNAVAKIIRGWERSQPEPN